MTYRERLSHWAVVRLLTDPSDTPSNPSPNLRFRLSAHVRWVVIARFHKRSDADGYAQFLRQQLPQVPIQVVFESVDPAADGPLEDPDHSDDHPENP
jgi:hypothetical protein